MRYRPLATSSFIEQWFSDGPTSKAVGLAPVVMFDRKDEMQTRYIRRRARGNIEPPRHYVPSTADFATAIVSGMGWGYISDLQAASIKQNQRLVEFDPGSSIEVSLHWQQWKLPSKTLDQVALAVCEYAKAHLR
jgi:LysR family transcriptional regulator (chromosome initiation inhibitor)